MATAADFVRNTNEGAKPWCVFASDGVKKLGAFATEGEAKMRLDELAAINVDAAPVLRTDAADFVQRFDVGGRLGRLERTPSGGVRVDARLTRTGIFEYERADGTVVRELRRPEEVFAEKSLATLQDAPVTIGHPDSGARMVSPATFRADSVGHVREKGRVDESRFVTSSLAIQDADAIKRCDSGDLSEISAGYGCKIDSRPGVYQGQPYDVEQKDIAYNHVALLPRGSGRAGADVALRLDARAAFQRGDAFDDGDHMTTEDLKKLGALEAQVKDLTAARDREQARADAADKKVVDLTKELTDERDPKRLDERVTSRSTFVGRARKILGAESKFDGKTDDEIMREALKKAAPELDLKDRSADYVRARFDAEVERAGTGAETPLAAARRDALGAAPAAGATEDDGYEPPPRLQDAWKPRVDAKK